MIFMYADGEREELISLRESIQIELISNGKYKCCLEKPCTYCIEKTPGHGEGAICTCLEDIANGIAELKNQTGEEIKSSLTTINTNIEALLNNQLAPDELRNYLQQIKDILIEKGDRSLEKLDSIIKGLSEEGAIHQKLHEIFENLRGIK